MISVIIPSIRLGVGFARALDSISNAAAGLRYEVIVVSDQEPSFTQRRATDYWLTQPRLGTVHAVNAGAAVARGDYLFTMNDESWLEPGALWELQIAADVHGPGVYGPRQAPSFDFRYFGEWFAAFPFAHKSITPFFDPAYGCFYADPDLSLRARRDGYEVREVKDAVIHHDNGQDFSNLANRARFYDADRATFELRWGYRGRVIDP